MSVNLPNLLTIFRIVLIPLYLYVFFSGIPFHVEIALGILILAGVTDIADGYIARKHKLVTTIGIMLTSGRQVNDAGGDRLIVFDRADQRVGRPVFLYA
ncbi:CDP-alcohol phosphatidyltransferase family protein [Streptococcus pneumoniae]